MAVQVKQMTCYTCKHFKEGYYKYYTHDNRMVECYRSGCQKQFNCPNHNIDSECIHWESRKGALG